MKKLFFCIVIIALIIAGVYVAKEISKDDLIKTGTNVNNDENKTKEENNLIENTLNPEENIIEESNVSNEENPEEIAKDIVKNNWGEDDSVYYSYDGIDKKGRYIICVREKSTTKALYWYYVDILTGTFDIE